MLPETAPFRARRLSLTPLVDVIFLLLMFFMLSSTFSRLAEIELAGAGTGLPPAESPRFLRLTEDRMTLNGRPVAAEEVAAALRGTPALLLSVDDTATAQRLADLLTLVRGVQGLSVAVIR